jgi:ketosteroid isomerase-like protein
MRVEIHETVQTPDPEVVLRALEMCSREVSTDVVRIGDRITVQGLGPSPRSKNKHDTTVFSVNVENNATVIRGEVNFQASALLGDTSQQEVVRSKLHDLFEQMKAQIHLDSMRVAAYTAARRSASSSTVVLDRPEDRGAIALRELDPPEEKLLPPEEKIPPPAAPETVIEALTAAPDAGWGAAALTGEPEEILLPERIGSSGHVRIAVPAAAPPVEHPLADVPDVKDGPERATKSAQTVPQAAESVRPTEAKQTPAKETGRNRASNPKPDAGSGLEEELSWGTRIPPYRLQPEENRTSGWKQFALGTTIVVMLLALVAGMYRLYSLQHKRTVNFVSRAANYVPPPGIQSTAAPAPLPGMPKAPEASSPAPKASSPESTPTKPDTNAETRTNNVDVKRCLQGWAASMQTKDANAQASFYADKFDRYLDQRNVGRGAVLRDREATIRMRKGLWTMKMENVVIERQTDSEAEVRLTKHFIDEPEQSEILESYVPTHLTLKRINGQWKITSEQDQPTISVSPWKAQGGMLNEENRPEIRDEQGSAACVGACSS